MGGVEFDLIFGAVVFLFTVWGCGRLFRLCTLPSILGELFAGILLGPHFLDIVPYASDGTCDTVIFDERSSSSSSTSRRQLGGDGSSSGSGDGSSSGRQECFDGLEWMPRWSNSMFATPDIWSFAGTLGVTLLIMESGMHINFEKVKQIGGKALIVAIVGTAAPLVLGLLLVAVLYESDMLWPEGFAAGCALAPTSVGISIKLLGDAKMLSSMAGQTTLTAAFVDDVFSLVLLVLLDSLASGDAGVGIIVLKAIAAFAFLGYGVFCGKFLYPRMFNSQLEKMTHKKGVSIQPRDELQLVIMLSSLVLYSYLGALIGSHLLGAFVAGMCFVQVPRSHGIWVIQFKRIIRWLIRIFFAATVGFAVPLKEMLEPEAIWKGLILGAIPGILCKVVSGLPARMKMDAGARAAANKASIMTRFGIIQPIQYLVGMAMVARGEFAFLVAYSARNMAYGDGEMLSADVYASLTWALVWALVLAPFLFRWALGVYMRATPIKRSKSIGGFKSAERNFVIQVTGQHHSGVLHEILNAIHGEGMDVLECRSETDGTVDCDYFVVQSRGKQKDFDDEKLEEIRHHIKEILGDPQGVVMFEAVTNQHIVYSAVEVQVVSASSESSNVSMHVSKRLRQLGLDVEEMDEQHKLQTDHGHDVDMERDFFYAVPSKSTEEEEIVITQVRVEEIKRALASTLKDEKIKAEVVVKPVADRNEGFQELQTFDLEQAFHRAKGTVWELICIGEHDVEKLSLAVVKLRPHGLRLLHCAHSHVHSSDESTSLAGSQQCSRFYVERVEMTKDKETDEDVETFTKEVVDVLKEVYKMSDERKFHVKPVSLDSLQTAKALKEEVVPGLGDLVPTTHQALHADLTRGLKQIPEGKQTDNGLFFNLNLSSADDEYEVKSGDTSSLGLPVAGARARIPSGPLEIPTSSTAGPSRDLEARVKTLEDMISRVERLETLEMLRARGQ